MKKQLSDNNLTSASGGAIPEGKEEEFDQESADVLKMWGALSEKDKNDVNEYFQKQDTKKKKR